MKVALGTIEVDDATRKAIRKALGKSGHATRGECKEYLLDRVDRLEIPEPEAPAEDETSDSSSVAVPAPGVEASTPE